jgi:NAD(P)-dependent dehydrogenase (short-subunit alcohol dehydrogenase family)
MSFEGKIAVVTGGGNGIGRAVALAFARHGARVAVLDIDGKAAGETEQQAGGKALAVETDVAEEDTVVAAFRTVDERLGPVSFLANVAGVELYTPFVEITSHEWDRNLAVNLKSVYLCCRQAIPRMARNGGGAIVNTASVQALATGGQIAPYAAAKAGIVALTKDLARDHGKDNIRVNAVSPGCIQTPMQDRALARLADPEEAMSKLRRAIPLQRIGSPDEIAQVVLFLCSPQAAYVSGINLIVDGGLMAKIPLPE